MIRMGFANCARGDDMIRRLRSEMDSGGWEWSFYLGTLDFPRELDLEGLVVWNVIASVNMYMHIVFWSWLDLSLSLFIIIDFTAFCRRIHGRCPFVYFVFVFGW